MIYAIRCDQPQFKDVEFLPGFNVVLADRSEQATEKDSRNGLGKTTLIDIVHFCLGGQADSRNRVMAEPLKTGRSRSISICAASVIRFPETRAIRGA